MRGGDQAEKEFLAECRRRMSIARASMSFNGPIRPLGMPNMWMNDPLNPISLREFGDWAKSLGWTLPERFPCSPNVSPPDKPLGTVERHVLLTIIAVLCKEAKLDYEAPAKTADLILSTAASMGIAIGKTTIKDHLKKIPEALAARTR